ncbi:MAG: pitrilysin family protein [Planctomycetota bacterium]|nr:pitrilysin family protein [Planctomycetota bacterium]
MDWEEIDNPVDESLFSAVAEGGLTVRVNPRSGWQRSFAALGINFGSVDRLRDGEIPMGVAHFLEHKLFEDRHGDVSDRFAQMGASTNAMTGFHGTTYIFTAVDEAMRCLDLLLDFVQEPYFTEELIAKEQGIIAQEIGMYEDDPDWRLFFGLLACLYDKHPVKENIAGTVESIAQIDASVLERCYREYYCPANMCLAVAGSVDHQEVGVLVEADQSGRVPNSHPRHVRDVWDESPSVVCERVELALPVNRPRLLVGVKEERVEGEGPVVVKRRLATRILLDAMFGRSSDTFENLYCDGLIDESFGASHAADWGFGFSTIGGETDHPEALENAVRHTLFESRDRGVDADCISRIQKKMTGALLRRANSPEDTAFEMLNSAFRGVTPYAAIEMVNSLSVDDLNVRLQEHVREEGLATSIVRPKRA